MPTTEGQRRVYDAARVAELERTHPDWFDDNRKTGYDYIRDAVGEKRTFLVVMSNLGKILSVVDRFVGSFSGFEDSGRGMQYLKQMDPSVGYLDTVQELREYIQMGIGGKIVREILQDVDEGIYDLDEMAHSSATVGVGAAATKLIAGIDAQNPTNPEGRGQWKDGEWPIDDES